MTKGQLTMRTKTDPEIFAGKGVAIPTYLGRSWLHISGTMLVFKEFCFRFLPTSTIIIWMCHRIPVRTWWPSSRLCFSYTQNNDDKITKIWLVDLWLNTLVETIIMIDMIFDHLLYATSLRRHEILFLSEYRENEKCGHIS